MKGNLEQSANEEMPFLGENDLPTIPAFPVKHSFPHVTILLLTAHDEHTLPLGWQMRSHFFAEFLLTPLWVVSLNDDDAAAVTVLAEGSSWSYQPEAHLEGRL